MCVDIWTMTWSSIQFYALKSEFSKPKIINSSNSMSTIAWNPRTRKSSKAWKLHHKSERFAAFEWCTRIINSTQPRIERTVSVFPLHAHSSNNTDYVALCVCSVGSLLLATLRFVSVNPIESWFNYYLTSDDIDIWKVNTKHISVLLQPI